MINQIFLVLILTGVRWSEQAKDHKQGNEWALYALGSYTKNKLPAHRLSLSWAIDGIVYLGTIWESNDNLRISNMIFQAHCMRVNKYVILSPRDISREHYGVVPAERRPDSPKCCSCYYISGWPDLPSYEIFLITELGISKIRNNAIIYRTCKLIIPRFTRNYYPR